MTPYSRPKLFDFYNTISQTELLENHTCHSGACLLLYPVYGTTPTRASYTLLKHSYEGPKEKLILTFLSQVVKVAPYFHLILCNKRSFLLFAP